MLSAWEMADMRNEFRSHCDKVATIQTPGPSIPGPGGTKPGPVVTTIRACRVMDLAGSEREVGGRLSGVADVLILLEHGDPVDWDATIFIDDHKYAVVRISADSTQPVALRVYGQEVT